MRVRLALSEDGLCDSGALLSKLGAEGAVDDDVDGRVDDQEEVADAGQVVRPLRKRLHSTTVGRNFCKSIVIFINNTSIPI
jgi:hypothetical protein